MNCQCRTSGRGRSRTQLLNKLHTERLSLGHLSSSQFFPFLVTFAI